MSDDTKLMIRENTANPGKPRGVLLSATTTVWMPKPVNFHRMKSIVISYLRTVPCNVSKSQDLSNGVSLLRTRVLAFGENSNNVLILQETCTDASGSIIVHTAIDSAAMDLVLNGNDSTTVAILPSGIAIVPDRAQGYVRPENSESGQSQDGPVGSLLIAGFQILANTVKSLTHPGIKAGIHWN